MFYVIQGVIIDIVNNYLRLRSTTTPTGKLHGAISVSVSNEILPIKAHLLDWSNKTQCYYIPIVNSIQHQSIYTSHVIYIVHIK